MAQEINLSSTMVQTETSFLELLDAETNSLPEQFLLPHEAAIVDNTDHELVQKLKEIVEEKKKVMGGDDWHDGQLRASDLETNRTWKERTELRARFMGATIIQYPAVKEKRVTLGSRVTLQQNGYDMVMDVIGFRAGYPDHVIDTETGEEVTGVSPDTPVAKAILGKIVGEVVTYNPGAREFTATIGRINQTAISEYFLAKAGVKIDSTDN